MNVLPVIALTASVAIPLVREAPARDAIVTQMPEQGPVVMLVAGLKTRIVNAQALLEHALLPIAAVPVIVVVI